MILKFFERVIFLFLVKIILFVIIFLRLVQLSIIKNPYYTTLSNHNRINLRIMLPQRGRIVDINNQVIADTAPHYRCYITAENKQHLGNTLKTISDMFGKEINIIGPFTPKRPVLLKHMLSWEDMVALEVKSLPGVHIEPVFRRFYPDQERVASFLGYTSLATDKDDKALQHPFLSVGHGGGIESYYDDALRGEFGYVEEELDAKRRLVRVLSQIKPQKGQVVQCQIDIKLQNYIYTLLENDENIRGAGAIVMDVHTGAIHAFVSYPSFDPNLFVDKVPVDTWRELNAHAEKPLFNKLVQGQYAPGSVFKIMMAMTALEENVVPARVHCPGYYMCGNRKFHCWKWKQGGHGWVDLHTALASSCDVYFYHLATKLSVQKVGEMCRKFGLGEKTHVDLVYEKEGLIPQTKWLNYQEVGELLNLSIGQGRLLVTPLQLAVMMSGVVNGGFLVTPYFVNPTERKKIDIGAASQDIVHKGLKAVTEYGTGSRYRFFIGEGKEKTLGFGGKTGTTQVYQISLSDRKKGKMNQQKPYHLRDHALFAGFAPADNPEYAVVVMIEHGGSGSIACGVAQKIIKFIYDQG